MSYTLLVHKYDKRCSDNIKLVSKEFDTLEQLTYYAQNKVNKIVGDSVEWWENDNLKNRGFIELQKEKRFI